MRHPNKNFPLFIQKIIPITGLKKLPLITHGAGFFQMAKNMQLYNSFRNCQKICSSEHFYILVLLSILLTFIKCVKIQSFVHMLLCYFSLSFMASIYIPSHEVVGDFFLKIPISIKSPFSNLFLARQQLQAVRSNDFAMLLRPINIKQTIVSQTIFSFMQDYTLIMY